MDEVGPNGGSGLVVALERDGQRWVVTVAGELDAASAEEFTRAVEPVVPGPGDVVVELAGVDFVDSSGLRVVLSLREQVVAAGRDLRLAHPSRQVLRLLEVTGLAAHLLVDGEHPEA